MRPRFDKKDLTALMKAVENGKGLMMLGGYQSFGPGGYYGTELRNLLPIEMSRFERQELDPVGAVSPDLHLAPETGIALVPTRPHPITRLASDAENADVWKRLPPLNGANRFSKLKDNAQILLESDVGDPMLVAGGYGRGRVLAFAADSTRRWWQHGHEIEHKRFWRQIVMWLAHREDDQRSDVWVKLPKRRFPPKASIRFTAGTRSPSGDPLADAELTAILKTPDGKSQNVSLKKGKEAMEGELSKLTQAGDYLLEVKATTGNREIGSTRAIFQILDRDVELTNTAQDPGQLARIARLTKDVDGRLVAAEELPRLLRELKRRLPQEKLDVQTRWRLGDTWWDAWLFFAIVVGLLTGEWALRKKWGLV